MLCLVLSMADTPKEKRKIEQLYEAYNRLMYAVAYNILRQNEDAEDAVLHSWEKIITHLEKINKIHCKETESLIVIIVERTSLDHYRQNKRQRKVEVPSDKYESSPYFVTKDAIDEHMTLYQALRDIPKIYSDTLILFYINGYHGREIADILGISEAATMTRLSRGRQRLKEALEKYE